MSTQHFIKEKKLRFDDNVNVLLVEQLVTCENDCVVFISVFGGFTYMYMRYIHLFMFILNVRKYL